MFFTRVRAHRTTLIKMFNNEPLKFKSSERGAVLSFLHIYAALYSLYFQIIQLSTVHFVTSSSVRDKWWLSTSKSLVSPALWDTLLYFLSDDTDRQRPHLVQGHSSAQLVSLCTTVYVSAVCKPCCCSSQVTTCSSLNNPKAVRTMRKRAERGGG